ncbi:hypothetical protein [Methanolobus profundi]|uniref:Uncharacterized protein n=1 Tax=Methanolobus profundi TaxID=487685 RepID=A0A1I4RCQ5_9EURY|nr:hypothetical protein [Methanolobus profundi]SFM49683.1 hypothetical protein SAMN04488696_1486 [Methanolobus profundi]
MSLDDVTGSPLRVVATVILFSLLILHFTQMRVDYVLVWAGISFWIIYTWNDKNKAAFVSFILFVVEIYAPKLIFLI